LKVLLSYVNNDPTIITKWIKMFFRYYQNWVYESYDYSKKRKISEVDSKKLRKKEMKFSRYLRLIDSLLRSLKKRKKTISVILVPITNSSNTLLKKILPIFEPIYSFTLKLLNPISNQLNNKILKFTEYANPSIFRA